MYLTEMIVYILYVLVPLALHNTLDLRRAERVRTLDALRCAFVVIAYYAAVAFRMTSMCGINRRNSIPIIELAGWLRRLRVGIVMQRSGVRFPAKAYKRFRALLPRISSVSSIPIIELAGWLRRLRVGIVMQRSGVRFPAKAYKRFRALLPRISSVSSLINLTHTKG